MRRSHSCILRGAYQHTREGIFEQNGVGGEGTTRAKLNQRERVAQPHHFAEGKTKA